MVRVAAASDFHGNIGFQVPECDLLILAGDYTPLWSSAEDQQPDREFAWWRKKFMPWLERQKKIAGFERVIIGGGNHDCFLEHVDTRDDAMEFTDSFDWIEPAWPDFYTATSTIGFEHLKIGVHSITSTINQRPWPFSYARKSAAHNLAVSELESVAAMGTYHDIIVSHGPPAMILDKTYEGKHVGCPHLAKFIFERSPKLVICGHIHEHRGESVKFHSAEGHMTKAANVSIVDRDYSQRGGKISVFDVV